ncbi:MAG: MFS transporter, partial [Mixta calida]|nr:MFS transporter [Mixta calida]
MTAISWVFFGGVIGLALMAIFFSRQMLLNRKTHLVVLEEVARIKAGGEISDIKPEVRAVIEALVGYPYEQCWGRSAICQKMKLAPLVDEKATEPKQAPQL